MSSKTDLFQKVQDKLGQEDASRILLIERAANQRHWWRKLNQAIVGGKTDYDAVVRVEAVMAEMLEEANRYDPPGEA